MYNILKDRHANNPVGRCTAAYSHCPECSIRWTRQEAAQADFRCHNCRIRIVRHHPATK